MHKKGIVLIGACLLFPLSAFASFMVADNGYYGESYHYHHHHHRHHQVVYDSATFAARMPDTIAPTGEKVVIVNPNVHAWGAYGADGKLVKGGIATAGRTYCPDIGRHCKTKSGSFHIKSLGSADCKSTKFPVPDGGAPMPYCMYFNGGQALHGSYEVVDGNASHGCVRLKVADAEWLRFHFVNVGTHVIVKSY